MDLTTYEGLKIPENLDTTPFKRCRECGYNQLVTAFKTPESGTCLSYEAWLTLFHKRVHKEKHIENQATRC